jgi:uroporphyrinogen-III synthase
VLSQLNPLAGKRVIITRAKTQSAELLQKLTELGAIPISLPMLSFAPPADCSALDEALIHMDQFDWIIFTSANAVRAVIERGNTLERVIHETERFPLVAAVGPATRAEAERAGFPVSFVAVVHSSSALAAELGSRLSGKRVFLPRSDRANADLPSALQRGGAKVTDVIAYQTVRPGGMDKERLDSAIGRKTDAILFFSPSAVHFFADTVGHERLGTLDKRMAVVSVGPTTARALTQAGIQGILMASDTTVAAVIAALTQHFEELNQLSVTRVKRS